MAQAVVRSAEWRSSPHCFSRHEEENPELADMTRRFWVACCSFMPLFVIGMSDMIPRAAGLQRLMSDGQYWLGAVDTGDASGAVGRLAVLRARLAIDRQSQPRTCSR